MISAGVRLVALLIVVAPTVQAQDRRLMTRLDPETAAAVTRVVDSVRAAGLPAEALVGVALEGASRRASNERILGAVREYASALGVARLTLGDSSASDERRWRNASPTLGSRGELFSRPLGRQLSYAVAVSGQRRKR